MKKPTPINDLEINKISDKQLLRLLKDLAIAGTPILTAPDAKIGYLELARRVRARREIKGRAA